MSKLALASIAGGLLVATTIVATLPPGAREIVAMMGAMLVTGITVAAGLSMLPGAMQRLLGCQAAIWTARVEKIIVPGSLVYSVYSLYVDCANCPSCGAVDGQNIDNDGNCFAFAMFAPVAVILVISSYFMLKASQQRLTKRLGWATSSTQGT